LSAASEKETVKMKVKRRRAASALVAAAVLALSACGGPSDGNNSQGSGNVADIRSKEWVYVPEFLELEDENASYYDMQFDGENLYYTSYQRDETTGSSGERIVRYNLEDQSSATVPISLNDQQNLNSYAVAADGSIYAMIYDYSDETPGPEGYPESKSFLCKYDAQGQPVFSKDISEELKSDDGNSYVRAILLDGEGRIYLPSDSVIRLFDAEGNGCGSVSLGNDSWISSSGCDRDGNVYVSYHVNSGDSSSYVLAKVDFEKKALGETYNGFIGGNGDKFSAGVDCDFLIQDGTSCYAYNMADQSREKLFDWLDSDINGSYVTFVGTAKDGRVLAVVNDWESRDNSVALLTKTKASEVEQKETIVLAVMGGGSDLKAAAVKFNKTNDKYRISIKEYVDYSSGWSETLWNDALTNFNNDITSNNCPDIIGLNSINVEQLAVKGVFEDITPYLEGSSVIKKEDMLDNILEAFTFDGKLVGIPGSFELSTVMGRPSDVGDEPGWTLSEMIEFADAHPEAELFDNYSKSSILNGCLMYNEEAFIDWSTGECHFDSDEFKSLLEFVNRFPDDDSITYEEGRASTPTRIQNGEVLLDTAYIYDFDEIQLYKEIFGGEVTCIGYPTTDGSSGTAMQVSNAYGISSKSAYKDGAWEFIESMLVRTQDDDSYRWGFPNSRTALQEMAAEAVKVEYVTDENGELVKDENGEPIPMGGGHGIGYEDGWEYTYRIPTQEEADQIMELIETAKPVASSNEAIMNIIKEEAEGFFKGQKSVDDVANIIQSRISIYVSENS